MCIRDRFKRSWDETYEKNFLIMKQQSLDLEFQNYIEMQDMQSCSFFEEILERVNNFLSSNELSLILFGQDD